MAYTHISGHPSATSRAQDSESTSAEDRCSTAGLRHHRGHMRADIRSRYSHTPNYMQIGKKIVTDTPELQSIRSSRGDDLKYC